MLSCLVGLQMGIICGGLSVCQHGTKAQTWVIQAPIFTLSSTSLRSSTLSPGSGFEWPYYLPYCPFLLPSESGRLTRFVHKTLSHQDILLSDDSCPATISEFELVRGVFPRWHTSRRPWVETFRFCPS